MQNSGLLIKKLLLGVAVVVAFVTYSFVARHNSAKSQVAASNNDNLTGSGAQVSNPASSISTTAGLKNGTFKGSVEDAFYGMLQVSAVISGGKLVDVQFLQFPNDNPHSRDVSNQSLPILKQEAISSQSANVNTVTGATDTSFAFAKSLAAALKQA